MPSEFSGVPAEELIRIAYKENNVEAMARELINSAGEAESEPVRYTHELWYSKAKTMLPSMAAKSLGLEEEKVQTVSAAVDVLWTLSVVVDDIYDIDEMRRGKPAAWKVFGKAEAYKSAETVLRKVLEKLAIELSPIAAKICKQSIEEGMKSIKEHKKLGFENTQEDFEENYKSRDAFFSAAPMEILAAVYIDKSQVLVEAGSGLETYYLGGQIGNDLDDLFGGAGRTKKYSDIRSGLVTLPIKIMWDRMDKVDRVNFMNLFGKGELSEEESTMIEGLLEKHQIFEKSMRLIEEKYAQAKVRLRKTFTPDDFEIFESLCEQQLKKFRGYS